MLIGAMNHPRRDPVSEVRTFAAMGLQFVDLTLEPPLSSASRVDVSALRDVLSEHRLGVVGHTAYYLPLASPFEGVRRGAVRELARCLRVFAALGAKLMNLHPAPPSPMQTRDACIQANLRSIRELLPLARELGVELMIENLPEHFNTVTQLSPLLDAEPELSFHLDVGHACLHKPRSTASALIQAFGDRIRHVHLHDNNGRADLHQPLGSGKVQAQRWVRELKASGYDGTITLEVFTPDTHYLEYSAAKLRQWWDGR